MKQDSRRESILAHTLALAGTLLVLLLFASLMLHVPAPTPTAMPARAPASMRVTLLPREPRLPVPAAPSPPAAAPKAPPKAPPKRVHASPPTAAASARPTAPTRPHAEPAESMQARLYTHEGRVRMGEVVNPLDPGHAAVPPGMEDARVQDKARRVLERINPIDYHETRFEKDWKSDGTLGDVAVQSLNRGMKRINGMIWGKEVQSVKARPPPDVRFNPGLAENGADLGSEATGDAYKAAPIPHETIPDLKGGASRRIREELAAVEGLATTCDASRRDQVLATVRTHLADLERVEHALAHGADPVMAEQLLPRQADSAYDLARRALWYARHVLGACGSKP